MIKQLRRLIVTSLAATALLLPVLVPAVAHAADDISGGVACGTNFDLQDNTCDTSDPTATATVNSTVKLGINLFSAIVGIIAVVMIVVGGIRYITSGGDSGNVTAAKNTILYAVIGLIIVALAQIIVRFVLTRFVSGSGAGTP